MKLNEQTKRLLLISAIAAGVALVGAATGFGVGFNKQPIRLMSVVFTPANAVERMERHCTINQFEHAGKCYKSLGDIPGRTRVQDTKPPPSAFDRPTEDEAMRFIAMTFTYWKACWMGQPDVTNPRIQAQGKLVEIYAAGANLNLNDRGTILKLADQTNLFLETLKTEGFYSWCQRMDGGLGIAR